ncbi:MAG: 50S ribosomal protein L11 methyltransferase [Myxococcota bacterium]
MSSTGWLELTVQLPASIADDAAAALISAGASGVQVLGTDTLAPPDDELSAVADHVEPIPVEEDAIATLIATFEDTEDPSAATPEVLDSLEGIGLLLEPSDLQWQTRENTDWAERWKDFFEPLELSPRFWVIPSWRKEYEVPDEAIQLFIDPGMAFGTGQHATTALCAELIDRRLRPNTHQSLFDVGTGSGILAIAAAKLGVARILGIDIDPEAVEVAKENARLNDVDGSIELSDRLVQDVHERFDWVVANILAAPLIQLAPHILKCLVPGGQLVLSGLLSGIQAAEVTRAFEAAAVETGHPDLRLIETLDRGEWAALRFAKSP